MSGAIAEMSEKFERIRPHLNESGLRLWVANEALSLGYGGVSKVARATGVSRTTIHAGVAELKGSTLKTAGPAMGVGRCRRAGGGRKRLTENDPGLLEALNRLVDPVTRGDPESCLRWTSKSTTKLAKELTQSGHGVSQRSVCDLLAREGYSLQRCARKNNFSGLSNPMKRVNFFVLLPLKTRERQSGGAARA